MASKPINSSGFKLALELLLKAPLPPGRPRSIPYSFGTRAVGSSKLSSKTMLLYVGQLLSLYSWAWGLFFNALFGVAGAIVVVVLESRLGAVVRGHRSGVGLGLPGGGYDSPRGKLTSRRRD